MKQNFANVKDMKTGHLLQTFAQLYLDSFLRFHFVRFGDIFERIKNKKQQFFVDKKHATLIILRTTKHTDETLL